MHRALDPYASPLPVSGDIAADAPALLTSRGYPHTARHSAAVAAEAARLARRFGLDANQASIAGWLHDISAVIPGAERVAVAEALGLEVLPEERAVPMIIHQKLSAVIAAECFGVTDPAVLGAIGCHTTLRAAAGPLDLAVFVADKIAWDQPGDPPYLAAIVDAVELSLDAAARVYLEFLWARRATIPVVHPWFAAAYHERCAPSLTDTHYA